MNLLLAASLIISTPYQLISPTVSWLCKALYLPEPLILAWRMAFIMRLISKIPAPSKTHSSTHLMEGQDSSGRAWLEPKWGGSDVRYQNKIPRRIKVRGKLISSQHRFVPNNYHLWQNGSFELLWQALKMINRLVRSHLGFLSKGTAVSKDQITLEEGCFTASQWRNDTQ